MGNDCAVQPMTDIIIDVDYRGAPAPDYGLVHGSGPSRIGFEKDVTTPLVCRPREARLECAVFADGRGDREHPYIAYLVSLEDEEPHCAKAALCAGQC